MLATTIAVLDRLLKGEDQTPESNILMEMDILLAWIVLTTLLGRRVKEENQLHGSSHLMEMLILLVLMEM